MSSIAYSKYAVASSTDAYWLTSLCMYMDDDMYGVYKGNCGIENGDVICHVPYLYKVRRGAPNDNRYVYGKGFILYHS